jgi:glycosyltransferase involved in cell wall biosynthesis
LARIALVCEPPDGGVAEHVLQLVRRLPEHGHTPLLLVPPGFAHLDELRADGHDVRTLHLRRDYSHPHHDARALGGLVRALGGADLVHAHSAKAGVLGRLAARLARLPAVYTPHGFPFVGEMSGARRRFGVVVERGLAPVTAALVCVCEFERDLARETGLRARRIEVVHNGCPPCDETTPVDEEVRRLRARGPVIGAVSTLRRAKRLDVLLDALPAILAAVPDASLVIAGEGPEGPALHAQAARLGLSDDPRLRFAPFTPPAARYLRGLDVYVLSSSWEAFPIGPLEAQACGVPQVVSAVGGTRESVVPETGLLVPAREPGALARAVIELLRDPARRAAMSAASRSRHAERFTVERMVAGTAAVYDAVL